MDPRDVLRTTRKALKQFEDERSETATEIEAMWKFPVVVTEDEEDGGFVAEVPRLPGCVAQGDTLDEVTENIRTAVDAVLKARLRRVLGEDDFAPDAVVGAAR